jgi:DNA repair protein RadC
MATLRMREMSEDELPREKLIRLGPGALTDIELIAILLRTGMEGKNVLELSRELLGEFRSLNGLARCSVAEMSKIKGIGEAKAVQIVAAFGLASRLARETLTREKLETPELIYALLGAEMRALSKESLRVVLLDTKFQLIRVEEVSHGSLNESLAHPREVFRPALIYSAFAVILVHNHPSGDPAPSSADNQLTRRLAQVAELLQIRLLDHVIIGTADNGRQPYFSFKEAQLI